MAVFKVPVDASRDRSLRWFLPGNFGVGR